MPTTLLHGFTSFDHMAADGVIRLPNWDSNPSATVTIVTPGLSGIGQAIGTPNALPYKFSKAYDVAVCRVLFKPTATTTLRNLISFCLSDNSDVVVLQLTAAGKLQVALQQVATPATVTSTDSRTLVSGTVYALEFGAYFHNGHGEVRVLLDGLEDVSLHLTAVTTQANVGSNIDRVVFTDPDGVFDDFSLRAGNNGLRLTDFLSDTVGNPKFVTLFPNLDGLYSGFLGATAGLHYLEVNETQGDGDTSYLYANQSLLIPTRESWAMQDIAATPTRIYSLASTILLTYDISVELDIRQFIRSGNADFEAGEGERGNTGYLFFTRQWDLSPATGTYWTDFEVNNAELGVNLVVSGGVTFEDRVTQAVFVAIYTDGVVPSVASPTTDAAISALKRGTHYLATLFKIQRPDGTHLFFTDHNASLIFDGDTYVPAGGLDASARRREVALKEPNLEVQGIIASDHITVDDLRAGRYRGAIVTEMLVDWRHPWAGAVQTSVYLVQNVGFNGSSYVAQLAGLTSKLRHYVGDVYGRVCRYNLGDAGCKVQLSGLTYRGVRVLSVTDRRIFNAHTADIHGLRPDDYFTFGVVLWKTGANQGLSFTVKDYASSARRIEQQLPCPFTIQVDDLFDISPGCNLLFNGDCKDKFDNQINFGGYPYIPGTDSYVQAV